MKKRIMKIMLAVITCATVGLNYIPVNAEEVSDPAKFEVASDINGGQKLTFKIIGNKEVQLGNGKDPHSNFEGALIIPETVTNAKDNKVYKVVKVAEFAFQDNVEITSVIGNSITSIGQGAFQACTGLESIHLPLVTTIKIDAFTVCTGLISIDLPKATDIGEGAFYGCQELASIKLPEATVIGEEAFQGCQKLTSISLPEAININGHAFFQCTRLTDINLPKATGIGEWAFYECTGLTSISLPKATKIGVSAFESCGKFTSINLPKATDIGRDAFYGCDSLIDINLPEATDIGQYAFWDCSKLESISLPKAKKIGYGAFSDCTLLKSMVLGITDGEWYLFEEIGEYPETIYLLDEVVTDVIFDKKSYTKELGGKIEKYDIDIIADPVSVIQELGTAATLSVNATISLEDPWNTLSYQWEKQTNGEWVTLDGKTEATLVFNSLTKEDAGMYQCKVTSVANPTLAKPTATATITVNPSVVDSIITGIVNGATYKKGITLDVSIAGAGMDNTAPIEGAIRYQPKSWKVDTNKGVFTDTYATTIETKDLTVGNKTLEVTFDQQIFNDGTWNTVARTTYTKNIQFHLEAAVIEEDKSETGDTTKTKNPKTGDTTNVGYLSLGVLISGIIIIGCLKKKKINH